MGLAFSYKLSETIPSFYTSYLTWIIVGIPTQRVVLASLPRGWPLWLDVASGPGADTIVLERNAAVPLGNCGRA
jgi:hypothetical protein